MPYNEKQMRLFGAAAHNPKFAKKVGIPMKTAAKLLAHGKKKKSASKTLSR